jgi:hypothetical protein
VQPNDSIITDRPAPPKQIFRRDITILGWRNCQKNTLLGFADVKLPSGIVIRGVGIHQKGERRWLGLPARPYETDSGSTSWAPVIEIPDRETRERFEGLVLDALDKHLGRVR